MFDGYERFSIETAANVTIAGVTGGSGPPVLLLHGFPQTKALWARVAPLLDARYRIVAMDLRGYGESSKPDPLDDAANYAFREMARDAVAVMQSLGHQSFHVVGHDRGGRTAHRMALDHPARVRALAVLDIVPTHTMFMKMDRLLARVYWHWHFMAQPAPLPQSLIAGNPDLYFETSIAGWGAGGLDKFDADMLEDYRRHWNDPRTIKAFCGDYRAAALVDIEHDKADLGSMVSCPVFVQYGRDGVMAAQFDIAEEWRAFAGDVSHASVPGGHFFIDENPELTAEQLLSFLDGARERQ